jgi:hypothetical protein
MGLGILLKTANGDGASLELLRHHGFIDQVYIDHGFVDRGSGFP